MSIELKVSNEDKRIMLNLTTESQVLNNLHNERRLMMENKAIEILKLNNLDHKLYFMRFDGRTDKWEAHIKPGAIAIPTPGSNIKNIRGNGG